jgi:hypothetical protein
MTAEVRDLRREVIAHWSLSSFCVAITKYMRPPTHTDTHTDTHTHTHTHTQVYLVHGAGDWKVQSMACCSCSAWSEERVLLLHGNMVEGVT